MEDRQLERSGEIEGDFQEAMPGRCWIKRLKPLLALVIGLIIVGLVWVALARLFQNTSLAVILNDIRQTSLTSIFWAMALTLISFAFVSVYDFSALSYLGLSAPLASILRTSFCAYAVGNLAGFGPLTGGAIRFRFYRRQGLTAANVAAIVAFITLTYGLGVASVMALGLIVDSTAVATPLALPRVLLRGLGICFVIAMMLLVAMSAFGRHLHWRNRRLVLPRAGIMLLQFAGMFAELAATAAVLWILLPPLGISFPAFLPVFAIAIALGIASHVPAGLGAFEAVIIGLAGHNSPIDPIISALLVYRVIYYGLPLLMTSMLLAVAELQQIRTMRRATMSDRS